MPIRLALPRTAVDRSQSAVPSRLDAAATRPQIAARSDPGKSWQGQAPPLGTHYHRQLRAVLAAKARHANAVANWWRWVGEAGRRPWYGLASVGILVVVGTSCGGPTLATTNMSTTTSRPASTSVPVLTVDVTASVDHVVVGTAVTFTVQIRGLGVLSGESVTYGDGGTSGANSGVVKCGKTARADRTATYKHTYTTPGTYRFTDWVSVIAPPPSCATTLVSGTASVIVTATLEAVVSLRSGGE